MFYPSGQHLYAQYLEPSNFRKLSILPSFKNCTSFGDNYTEVVIYARNFYSKKNARVLPWLQLAGMKMWLFGAGWMLQNIVRCKQWQMIVMDPTGCQWSQADGSNVRDYRESRKRRDEHAKVVRHASGNGSSLRPRASLLWAAWQIPDPRPAWIW
jgi:hypothetical protein